MKNRNIYKYTTAALALTLAFVLGIKTEQTKAASAIQSQGKLVYNDEVIFDSSDISMIQYETNQNIQNFKIEQQSKDSTQDTKITSLETNTTKFITDSQNEETLTINYVKNQKTVSFDASLSVPETIPDETVLCTIKEGFIPRLGQVQPIFNRSTNSYAFLYFRANGEVKVAAGDIPPGNYMFSGTYITW